MVALGMTCNEEFSIIFISFKEKLLSFTYAGLYLTPPPALPFEYCSELLSLLPRLDVANTNNILEPSVPLLFPSLGKTDILVRRDSGFECFRCVFKGFIVLFDRLISFLFATCTLCSISTGNAVPRLCISRRNTLKGLMNYSFPNDTPLTPSKIPEGRRSVIFVLQITSFSIAYFLPFLCVVSLAS